MKYSVEFHMMFIKAEVEADSEEEAEQIASEEVYITTDWANPYLRSLENYGEFELVTIEEN